jgi:hypothetical protein
MAETRLLDRSTLASQADRPDRNPKVKAVHAALESLGRHDLAGASAAIERALAWRPPHAPMAKPAVYAPYPPAQGAMPPPPPAQPGYDQ